MENEFAPVISGISGRFPNCETIPEFRTKLYDGKSFMSLDPERWPINFRYQYSDIIIPSATGKFKYIKEFDPVVFKMNEAIAKCTDAITRNVLEPSFEAIMDAGLSPYELNGRNVAVFMTYDRSDSDSKALSNSDGRLYILGGSKTMMSNRVSFALNLTGPSFTYANDMFGNLTALKEACESVSKGYVEAAIVGVIATVMDPMTSVNLMTMNILSPDSTTRVFDKNANGYGRSDSLVTLFIQRAEDAKRIYASIDFIGYTYFGSNPNPYFHFDEDLLRNSLDELHKRGNYYDIDDVSFVEMGACGIKKFDKSESNFIADTFCKNRKSPLLVGSVKSNVGMTDCASPYVSLIKAIFALESGIIVQNQNIDEISDQIKAFTENKLKVVTKPTPLPSDKIVVNSVGITGSLSQVVLKRHARRKKSEDSFSSDNLPRLVLACARTEDGIEDVLKTLELTSFDREFISMINDVFCKDMPYHLFRGYSIISPDITYPRKSTLDAKGNKNRPVWFLFSGMGSQWNNMGEGLLKFPIIAETVKKCDQVLRKVGVDIYHILTTTDPTIFDNIMHSFVGIITIQIALVEVLKALYIKPDGIIGHSVGENACAYADGCLTLEQAVLSSYARGMASIETKTIRGMMAAVGKGYNQIKDVLPDSIEVACHNSATSCTLSGPTKDVENYVKQLQEQNVFAKAVNVANIAYHSKHIAPAAPNLLARLKQVIPTPIKRSPIWMSTSVAESDWDTPLAQYCSAEYLTNNLLNCVMFEEASKHIPSDALVIEIAPHGLLQAIMKRSLPETCANVALTKRNNEEKNMENLLTAIGQLYIHGLDVNVNALYPTIEYPVSRDTPSISQFAKWHRSAPDAEVFHLDLVGSHNGDPVMIKINEDSSYYYLRDHQINNRVVLPTSFFLYLGWWVFSIIQNKKLDSDSVVFEDIQLHKNVSMSFTKSQKFVVFFQKGSGKFQISKYTKSNSNRNSTEVISGVIYQPQESTKHVVEETNLRNVKYTISGDQFYTIFKNVGYQLKGTFHSLEEFKYDDNDCYAKIKWCNNWVSLLDSLLKFNMFSQMKNEDDLLYTHRIRKLEISTNEISSLENGTTLLCHRQFSTNVTTCTGLKMYSVENKHFPLSSLDKNVKFEGLRFVSHLNPRCQSVAEFFSLCLQIAVDSIGIMLKKNRRDDKFNVAMKDDVSCCDVLTNIVKNCNTLKTRVLFHEMKQALLNEYIKKEECCMLVIDHVYDIEKSVVDLPFLLVIASNDNSMRLAEIEKNFMQITKQQFTDKTIYLFKKKSFADHEIVRVEGGDGSRYVPEQTKQELAFIVKQSIDSSDLSVMFSDSKKPSDPRYLFVMDNEMPKNCDVEKQYVQDLPVVVLQNKEWGSYRNLSSDVPQSKENNKSLNDLSEDIQMDSIHLQYLSGDKQLQFQNGQTCDYGIEYSGIQFAGDRVMGLSLIDPNEPISNPDAILQWNVPMDWSMEDAATIPLAYTLAYRMLDAPVIRGKNYVDSVLINIGNEGPLCEACISILLSRNCTVYVTVFDSQEATLVKNKFPQLTDEQILNAQECAFQVEVLKMTNGEGVNLIVNCSSNIEDITESLNCASKFSYFLQIGRVNKWKTQNLGLYQFLKSISFVIIQDRISSLLKLPNSDKKVLKELIEDGIKTGVVVPLNKIVQVQGIPKTDNEYSEKNHAKNIFKWISNNDLCSSSNQKLRYDNNRSYIIVGGDKKNTCWFEVVEWLISKGARKFIATLDSFSVGPNISHRMNRLLNQRKATFILSSAQKTDSLQEAENLVQEASRIGLLEAVFFVSVTSAAGKKIRNMDLATRKLDSNVHLVSIFSSGLKECESRRFAGLPATVIHGNNLSRKLSAVLPQIDDILSQFDNSNSPTLHRIINTSSSEKRTADAALRNYLPRDMRILEEIAIDMSEKLEFVEVTTKTPRYSTLKNCFPMFIISTLGPKPLKGLLSNLMSPAFCCSTGTSKCSIKELASRLHDSLNSIQSKAGVTLMSETWATPIAFELIKLLDEDKRKYRLFILEGNPLTWKDRIGSLGPLNSSQFENNLIAELFNINSEIRLDTLLGVNKPLPQKISDYLCSRNYPSINPTSVIKILHSIQLGLEMISKYEYNDQLIKNTILLLQNRNKNKPLRISVTSKVFVHEEDDYQKFLSSYEVSKKINGNILYTLWYD